MERYIKTEKFRATHNHIAIFDLQSDLSLILLFQTVQFTTFQNISCMEECFRAYLLGTPNLTRESSGFSVPERCAILPVEDHLVSCRTPLRRMVLKNGRERLVCCYGAGMELVAVARTKINEKQQR